MNIIKPVQLATNSISKLNPNLYLLQKHHKTLVSQKLIDTLSRIVPRKRYLFQTNFDLLSPTIKPKPNIYHGYNSDQQQNQLNNKVKVKAIEQQDDDRQDIFGYLYSKYRLRRRYVENCLKDKSCQMYLKEKHDILQFLTKSNIVDKFMDTVSENEQYQKVVKGWLQLDDSEKQRVMQQDQLWAKFIQKETFIKIKGFIDLFVQYLLDNHRNYLVFCKQIRRCSNMSRPEEIFKKARRQRRKIIYHMGLTNSGKTYQAYQALKKAKTGVYLAPLRLLAWEIHQKLNNDGVKCDLVTGQEKIRHNVGATHLSSTIECLNYQNQYDVCVIDEIQLISDEYRGNAWTQAVLGANSKEIHICGDDRAYSLIKYMAEQTADQLIINRHKRLSTLHVHKKKFKLRDIQDGDCLICFGRTNLLKMVQQINKMKKSKCCAAIYGKLPPEVRKRQAGRFNRRQNGIKYMVASDAIGMGLNLSIKRIIFCQLKKQNNNKVYDLIDSYTIKQIAGRAGRYHNDGYVLTKDEQYIKYIDFSVQNNDINKLIEDSPFKSVNKELSLKQACLFPTYQQIVEFIDLVQDNFDTQRATFYKVFLLFQQNQKSDTKYFIQNAQSFQTRAEFLSDLDLDTIDAYNFCQAPLQSDNDSEMQKLHDLGRQFVKYNKVKLPKHLRSSKYYDHSLIDMQNLKMFEQMYQELSLYQWLFYKYQTAFVDIHLCNKRIKQIDEIIDRILQ